MEKFLLKRPIEFEGKEYDSFDLSGLEELSGEEYAGLLKQAENIEGTEMIPEKGLTFVFLTTARVAGVPYDLFKKLKAKDTARLRYTVSSFFLSED